MLGKNLILLISMLVLVMSVQLKVFAREYVCPEPVGWSIIRGACHEGSSIMVYACRIKGQNIHQWGRNSLVYTSYDLPKKKKTAYHVNQTVLSSGLKLLTKNIQQSERYWLLACIYKASGDSANKWLVQVGMKVKAQQCHQSPTNPTTFSCND